MEKQKYDAVLNTLLQKRIAENETRQTRGEPPLSLDEIRKQLKQPQMLAKNGMLDLFLSALDTNAYSKFQIEVQYYKIDIISSIFYSSGHQREHRQVASVPGGHQPAAEPCCCCCCFWGQFATTDSCARQQREAMIIQCEYKCYNMF
jgi:hypothetical protein